MMMPLMLAMYDQRHDDHPKKVIIIMSDSRSLNDTGYHTLSYKINARYAELHNYSIHFVHTPCMKPSKSTKKCIGCVHASLGERMVSWCKLLVVNRTLHEYPDHNYFLYLDSDAIVSTRDPLPLHYWNKTLNMFYNFPWPRLSPACAGIQLWKRTPMTLPILNNWWNTDVHRYNTQHDFEQAVLRTVFWRRFRKHINVIQEKTLVDAPAQRVRHIAETTRAGGAHISVFRKELGLKSRI